MLQRKVKRSLLTSFKHSAIGVSLKDVELCLKDLKNYSKTERDNIMNSLRGVKPCIKDRIMCLEINVIPQVSTT